MKLKGMGAYNAGGDGSNIFSNGSYFPNWINTPSGGSVVPITPKTAKDVNKLVAKSGNMAKAKISGIVNFAAWLQAKFPDVYAQLVMDRPDLIMPEFALAGLAGLASTDPSTDASTASDPNAAPSTDWGKTITDLLTPLIGAYQQSQLVNVNIKRAEAGLDPIDANALGAQVQVGVSPQVLQTSRIAGIAIIGVAVLAIFMFSRKR
jgi:hypothetical protein